MPLGAKLAGLGIFFAISVCSPVAQLIENPGPPVHETVALPTELQKYLEISHGAMNDEQS